MDYQVKKEIKRSISTSIRNFFTDKKVDKSHILDTIFPAERRIRSLIGGLETSLGTTVWEPIAKTIARSNGFEVIEENILRPNPYPNELRDLVSALKDKRLIRDTWVSSEYCKDEISLLVNRINRRYITYVKPPTGKGVDIWLRKDGVEWVFDSKTNQPNRADFSKFDSEILDWYAYRLCKAPETEIYAKIAFPFNPYKRPFWDVTRNKAFPPMEPGVDAVVQDEFWDFLSGEKNTWQEIFSIFNELGASNFGQEFNDIFYGENGSGI